MTKMPYATSGQGWTTFQNRIYVAGGELRDAHMDAIFRDFVVFDPGAERLVSAAVDADRAPRRRAGGARQPHPCGRRAHRLQRQRRRGASFQRERSIRAHAGDEINRPLLPSSRASAAGAIFFIHSSCRCFISCGVRSSLRVAIVQR